MTTPSDQADELIPIALHPKHWIVIVAAIEALNAQAVQRIAELKKQGVDQSTLPDATVSALAGPAIVRGILTKELTARGVMTPEANAKFGIDRTMEAIRLYRREQ